MTTRFAGACALLIASLFAVAGCGGGNDKSTSTKAGGSAPAKKSRTYVGRVSGTGAYIALVTDGAVVQGYLCDGHDLSTWLTGSRPARGRTHLRARKGGEPLGEATLAGTRATGVVRVAGKPQAWSGALSAGREGLYRAAKGKVGEPRSVEVGWIVLPDRSQRGATNLVDQSGGVKVSNAPVLRPGAGSVTVPKAGSLAVTKFIDPIGGF